MAVGRKTNPKGRNTGKQPFVMLSHFAFDCSAYRSLKPGPRTLLWEFIRRHNGANNGYIAFSQRDMAAAINVADRETVASYVRKLEQLGFIIASRRGAFSVKVSARRASEWTLTMFAVGETAATKEFMRWRAEIDGTEKPQCRDGKTVPAAANGVHLYPEGTEKPSQESLSRSLSRTENPSTYTSKAIGSSDGVGLSKLRIGRSLERGYNPH